MIPLKRNLAVLIAILATVGCSPANDAEPKAAPTPSATPQGEPDGFREDARLLLESDLRNYVRAVDEAKDSETNAYPPTAAALPRFALTPGTEISPRGYSATRNGFTLSLTNENNDSMWYSSSTGELVRSWEATVATEDSDTANSVPSDSSGRDDR